MIQPKQTAPFITSTVAMAENTHAFQSATGGRVVNQRKRITPSAKTANTLLNMKQCTPNTYSPITEESKLLAAISLRLAVLTLTEAGAIKKMRSASTEEIVLVFPSAVWTDELKLKEK